MNNMFCLDVIEICLLNLPENESVSEIKPKTILTQLNRLNWDKRKHSELDVRKILKEVFPIHKNRDRNTKSFKISRSAVEEFLKSHSILLRPIEHARESMCSKTSA